jgi:hypothetical protein
MSSELNNRSNTGFDTRAGERVRLRNRLPDQRFEAQPVIVLSLQPEQQTQAKAIFSVPGLLPIWAIFVVISPTWRLIIGPVGRLRHCRSHTRSFDYPREHIARGRC